MTVSLHETAPDFELPSNEHENGRPGKKYRLIDFRGKPVVLAFYPLDFSPVCTKENVCFRDDLKQFEALGARVLGISVDSAWTHDAFARTLHLSFPLLADFHPKGGVAQAYGLYNEARGTAKRATVIVDATGKVSWVKDQVNNDQRDNLEIIEALKRAG
jgi:peroxiredoxin